MRVSDTTARRWAVKSRLKKAAGKRGKEIKFLRAGMRGSCSRSWSRRSGWIWTRDSW